MTACSILTSPLPEYVTVSGMRLAIRTDFRAGILFSAVLADPSLVPATRFRLALQFYYGTLPDGADPNEAFLAALRFYNRLPDTAEGECADTGGTSRDAEPVFDFSVDGDRINAAFYAAYGIDLTAASLHWWQFLALLVALPPDCAFMRTVALRCMDPGQVKDDDTRRRLRKAKAQVRIRRGHGDGNKEGLTWRTDR